MTSRVRLGLKGIHTKQKQNKNLAILVDLYFGVLRQHCGRIEEANIQSSLSILLLKEHH